MNIQAHPSHARYRHTVDDDFIDTKAPNREFWHVLRAVLAVWGTGVWFLLILMPSLEQMVDIDTLALHLPYTLMGLVLLAAMFAAYNLKADKTMLWFLGVLLLLAGWV